MPGQRRILLRYLVLVDFQETRHWRRFMAKTSCLVINRGGVLEDTFWSPWPWPRRSSPWPWHRGLKSSKIGLSSARGQQYFLNCLNIVERLKNFFENVFLWRSLEKFLWRAFFFFFWRSPEKFLWRPFFFFGEGLRLCSWSLASRVSVLGKTVLGLGFFLCPWPWPRALCSRLHLWSLTYTTAHYVTKSTTHCDCLFRRFGNLLRR